MTFIPAAMGSSIVCATVLAFGLRSPAAGIFCLILNILAISEYFYRLFK